MLLIATPASVLAEQRILFAENFESGSATGWLFAGKGKSKVTEYEGNHSLNLSRQRNAQMTIDVRATRLDMTMQLAAFDLKKGESRGAEISSNGGERWQTLLTVTPAMADGITLHSNTGRIKNLAASSNCCCVSAPMVVARQNAGVITLKY